MHPQGPPKPLPTGERMALVRTLAAMAQAQDLETSLPTVAAVAVEAIGLPVLPAGLAVEEQLPDPEDKQIAQFPQGGRASRMWVKLLLPARQDMAVEVVLVVPDQRMAAE